MTAFQCPCSAGGVLEIGDDIDHLYVWCGCQDFFQFFHDHTVFVCGHFHKGRFTCFESIDGTQIGRAFHEDHVTFIYKYTGGEIQTLLRTAGHQNMVRIRFNVIFGFHSLSDFFPQCREAFRRRILTGYFPHFLHDSVTRLTELVYGKQFCCGQTACEGNNIGSGNEFQQIADIGIRQLFHSFRITHHTCFLLCVLHSS